MAKNYFTFMPLVTDNTIHVPEEILRHQDVTFGVVEDMIGAEGGRRALSVNGRYLGWWDGVLSEDVMADLLERFSYRPLTAYRARIFAQSDNATTNTLASIPGEVTSEDIKRECSRRILAVIKDEPTYSNMIGHAVKWTRAEAAGKLSPADLIDLDVLEAVQDWVDAMQAKCRALILARDATFEDDRHWPDAPAGAQVLSDRF